MNIKAIRTEYRGIVFDSKSEAVFARTLDLAGLRWKHHPGKHCGHPWDFLVYRTDIECDAFQLDEIVDIGEGIWTQPDPVVYSFNRPFPTLIEYKPAPPTATYIENLTEAMRANPMESVIIWGNPWNGPFMGCSYVCYPIFTKHGRFGWGDFCQPADNGEDVPYSNRHEIGDMFGITEAMAQEAREYRFDLEHINNPPMMDLTKYIKR